ncbi:MAG: N-acyl-D-amino-acid deacylase family protein, partial [Novosphingobium sp.]
LEAAPPAVNVAALVGHTTLRAATMDRLDRPATASERMAMRSLAAEAMAAGAIGMSSGLFYPPAKAAPMEEVMAIAEVVSEYGGIYATHLRDEAGAIDAAIDEALLIAERAAMPLIISHHKLMGEANFGRAPETLRRIVQASTRQEVGFDVYPYVAAASSFNLDLYRLSKRVLITWSAVMPDAAGRELDEVAAELGMSAEAALTALAPGGAVYFCMDENDLRHILASPDAMIGSDGTTTSIRPHPRLWGTFTRVLGRYARDEGLFPFEEAIRRMTSLPARRFRMAGRGVIAAGAAADLVVLDPANVADAADFENPVQPSKGVESVYVSGLPVYRDGATTGVRPGCILKGQQKRLK